MEKITLGEAVDRLLMHCIDTDCEICIFLNSAGFCKLCPSGIRHWEYELRDLDLEV